MTAPGGSYDGRVYAAGVPVGAARPDPPLPPAFQRGRLNNQAAHHRPNPGRPQVTWLTVAEVAAELRVSKMTVYRLVHTGELVSSRVGRSFRINALAVDEYLAGAVGGAR